MNERLFISLKELADSGYIFRITDNGGATLDVSRLKPTAGVKAKLRRLEKKAA